MRNQDIRNKAKEMNVKLWEIGEAFGMNDGNFSRRLRKEFTEEGKAEIFKVIQEIADGREGR